jgi:hypothetical protein
VWALGLPGSSIVCGGRDYNPTPNNRLDQSDEFEGCPFFWYPGIGTSNGMGCRNDPTRYRMGARPAAGTPAGDPRPLRDR